MKANLRLDLSDRRARTCLAAGAAVLLITGCAPLANIEQPPSSLAPPFAPKAGAPRAPALARFALVSGAHLAVGMDRTGSLIASGGAGYQPLMHPVAASGQGPDLYIADIGSGNLYRYDVALGAMAILPGIHAAIGTRLRAGADSSLYLLNAPGREVLHYARSGQLLGSYRNDLDLARAVDVGVDSARGRVLVADTMFLHLVAFHALGQASYVIALRARGGAGVQSIAAMAIGRDAIYLSDPLARCIVRVAPDGTITGRFGAGQLSQPAAIAVDRAGRVYVIDASDGTLKVFFEDALLLTLSPGALGLQQVSDVSIQGDELVLTDSPGAHVLLMRIGAGTAAPMRPQ